jgi:hypothetical protein
MLGRCQGYRRSNSDLGGLQGGITMVNYRKRLKMAAAGLTTQNEAAKRQAQKRLNELAEADKRRRKLKRLNKKRRDEKWRQVLAERRASAYARC